MDECFAIQDALKFPLIGSAVLVGLFALFKFLPKDLVNAVLTAYFVLLGTFAVTAAMLPLIEGMLPRNWQGQAFSLKQLTIPYIMKVSSSAKHIRSSTCRLLESEAHQNVQLLSEHFHALIWLLFAAYINAL